MDPQAIQDLRDSTGREVPVTRLDPLLIGSLFPVDGEDRIVVTPQEVPPLLPAALKAVEDRTFDTNRGVDPLAMLRALWVDLRSHRIEEGGSTLTQQLVKSYFLTNRQTLGRKVREAIMAVSLATHFSKDDLMNAYINEIFLGQDGNRSIHGFGLASEFYFGKPLSELDLPQVATLVAIVRGPTYYDLAVIRSARSSGATWCCRSWRSRASLNRTRRRLRSASPSVSRPAPRAPTIPLTSTSCGGRCKATIRRRS